MLQRGQYRYAQEYFNSVLNDDWKHQIVNLLMGIMYDKQNRPGLSRKYFAIAKMKKLRDLNKLPPKGTQPKNFRTQPLSQPTDYKVEIVDFKVVMTKD